MVERGERNGCGSFVIEYAREKGGRSDRGRRQ